MKSMPTERLLTLGMALTADKRTMERRVRGVFARKTSARAARYGALALALLLGAACFTTACQPQAAAGESVNLATNGNIPLETADASDPARKAEILNFRDLQIDTNRAFVVPRVSSTVFVERGSWALADGVDDAEEAKAAFLASANPIFNTNYSPDNLTALYYTDETGWREDVWRFDSSDGILAGASKADSLQLISADCKTIPDNGRHEGLLDTGRAEVACVPVLERVAKALGSTTNGSDNSTESSSYSSVTNGFGVQELVYFSLSDGRFASVELFGDEALTIFSVAAYPDLDCMLEHVYWRADLEWDEGVIDLEHPQNFRAGEPGDGDLTRRQALEYYYALVTAAGTADGKTREQFKEPETIFYIDYSGARENYWHIDGEYASMDVASSRHIFNVIAKQELGSALGLMSRPYSDAQDEPYLVQTQALLEAVLGQGKIVRAEVNAISDGSSCSIYCVAADGAYYDVNYDNGKLDYIDYEYSVFNGCWDLYKNWMADFVYKNLETGETFIRY